MKSGLLTFLKSNEGLVCDRYRDSVGRAVSKASLASLVDINVCEWLCRMRGRGSGEWLSGYFGGYVNGARVFGCDGYTCEVWCGHDGLITLRADVTAVVSGDVVVSVPDGVFARVFCSCGSLAVRLGARSRLLVHALGGTLVTGDGLADGLTVLKRMEDL